ncbi:hypothetical protein P8452_17282 [Trifolium repens]|nr:hypothetical protein P8452_17282 [Trifolium repens]
MLGKRSQHLIRKFSELLVFGEGATALFDTIGSPRSPFEFNSKVQSPKGQKSYEFGGVGLGIVVALDKSEDDLRYEVVPKHICTLKRNHSGEPIPVQNQNHQQNRFFVNEILDENSEDYTYVTYHDESNKPITKVFYDGGVDNRILRHDYYTSKNKQNNVGVFRRSSPTQNLVEAQPLYPTLDFLNSCHLCKKNLHGKDIFMYRGEKAFCSNECRSRQIMIDERKEKCRSSETSMSMELSSSPYTKDQMFSTGILVL